MASDTSIYSFIICCYGFERHILYINAKDRCLTAQLLKLLISIILKLFRYEDEASTV